jgi:hypothetical protein
MRYTTIGGLLAFAAAVAAPAAGQTPPAATATMRTVVASTTLSTVGDAPVHFKAVSVTFPLGQGAASLRPTGSFTNCQDRPRFRSVERLRH